MSALHTEAKVAGPVAVSGAPAVDLAITPADTLSSTDLSAPSTPPNEKEQQSPSGNTSKEFDPSDADAERIPRLGKDADIDADALSDENVIIRSGADASKYLLSLRDDDDPILTVRSVVLGTAFACFQAAMNQIYNVSQVFVYLLPTSGAAAHAR